MLNTFRRINGIFSSRAILPTRGLEEFFDNLPKSGAKGDENPIFGSECY